MNLKNISLATVIASVAFFTLISLMAIWKVIQDNDFVWKSLTSLAVVGFAGLVGVALSDRMKNVRGGAIVGHGAAALCGCVAA